LKVVKVHQDIVWLFFHRHTFLEKKIPENFLALKANGTVLTIELPVSEVGDLWSLTMVCICKAIKSRFRRSQVCTKNGKAGPWPKLSLGRVLISFTWALSP